MSADTGEPCAAWDVGCWSSAGIGEVVSKASEDALQQFVNNILEGFGKAVASLGSLWVVVPSPVTVVDRGGGTTGAGAPPAREAFQTILSYMTWTCAGIAVMSLIFAGVMMASRRRHGDGEAHMGRVGVIIFAVLLLSSASAVVTGFLPTAMAANESSSVVGWMQGQLQWYAGGLAILSILVAAGAMAWTQRATPAKDLLKSMLTLIAVAGAGLVVIRLATAAGDAWSVDVLNKSTDCDVTDGESNCFGTNIFAMIALTGTSPIGVFGLFILGFVAILATYAQIALMIFRGGMLVVLAGIFPLASSFTNTEIGKQWFKKTLAWTLAFLLYKPAAAIIYAIAFRMTGTDLFKTDGTGLFQILTGLALMLLSLVALWGLMRFIVPTVAAVTGGGGAGLLLAAAGAAAITEIATGAIRASNHGSGGGGGSGSGGGGDEGPSGSKSSDSGSGPGLSPAAGSGSAGGSAGGETAVGGGSAAAGGGSAAGGGAAAGGAAAGGAGGGAAAGAAAGPVGAGMGIAAGKIADGAKQAVGAAQQAVDGTTGSTESGS